MRTAPVRSVFFWVPYPMTTASLSVVIEERIVTSMRLRPTMFSRTSSKPRAEKTRMSFFRALMA